MASKSWTESAKCGVETTCRHRTLAEVNTAKKKTLSRTEVKKSHNQVVRWVAKRRLRLQICGQLCGNCYMFIMTSIFGFEITNLSFRLNTTEKNTHTRSRRRKRWEKNALNTNDCVSYEMHANLPGRSVQQTVASLHILIERPRVCVSGALATMCQLAISFTEIIVDNKHTQVRTAHTFTHSYRLCGWITVKAQLENIRSFNQLRIPKLISSSESFNGVLCSAWASLPPSRLRTVPGQFWIIGDETRVVDFVVNPMTIFISFDMFFSVLLSQICRPIQCHCDAHFDIF